MIKQAIDETLSSSLNIIRMNAVNKHIMIVEDEEQTRFTLSIILKKAGYKVTTAADGLTAFTKINNAKNSPAPIDFLLTDIQLPYMTGLELINKLNNANMSLPTLVITGYGDKKIVIELMRTGCREYIDKPFEPDKLLNRVESVFAKIEKTKSEEKKRHELVEKEKIELNRMLQSYKHNFESIREQFTSAVDSYKNLIQIEPNAYKVKSVCRYRHAMELGGDFIDIRNTETGCDILVADVAGHDMGASYHTVMIKAFFDENCRAGNGGEAFFKLLNKQLTENGKNNRMVTANYLSLNLEEMRGELITAAHPSIIIQSAFSCPRALNAAGDVLGIYEDVAFGARSFDIKTGDRLFLYTDGFIDICRLDVSTGKKEKLGIEGALELIKKHSYLPLKDMTQNIWNDALNFCGKKLYDDALILGVEIS